MTVTLRSLVLAMEDTEVGEEREEEGGRKLEVSYDAGRSDKQIPFFVPGCTCVTHGFV